jgi:hypothetical protein
MAILLTELPGSEPPTMSLNAVSDEGLITRRGTIWAVDVLQVIADFLVTVIFSLENFLKDRLPRRRGGDSHGKFTRLPAWWGCH